MSPTALLINLFAFACLLISFLRNSEKSRKSLKIAVKSLLRILPMVFIIIIFIGLLLGFVPKSQISRLIGDRAGFGGVLVVALLGAVLHIPSLISFPLAASLLERGASITSVAAFITSLTMIGVVTLPLEIRILGKRMALLRNGISFVIAIIIALIMGVIL
ncbi:MAG: permease [Candidatus Krumholzibacteriales bacterium]